MQSWNSSFWMGKCMEMNWDRTGTGTAQATLAGGSGSSQIQQKTIPNSHWEMVTELGQLRGPHCHQVTKAQAAEGNLLCPAPAGKGDNTPGQVSVPCLPHGQVRSPVPPRPHLSDGLGEGPAEPAQAGEGAGTAQHLSRAQGAQVGLQLQGQAVQHLRLLEAQLTCAKGGQLSTRGLPAPLSCDPHTTGTAGKGHPDREGSRDTSEPSQCLQGLQMSRGVVEWPHTALPGIWATCSDRTPRTASWVTWVW